MKRLLVLAIFACAGACALQAQVVDTTVCDILKNPASFNGKMVRIKGAVSAGFDQFIVRGDGCGQPVDAIWLAYPEGTKGKAGPDAMLQLLPAHNFAGKYTAPTRAAVTLLKDKEFKKFDSLLSHRHDSITTCLGCRRYQVDATLVGRLDGVADATLQRNSTDKIIGFGGFGNLNAYPARLVLQSVSDVAPKPIDYSESNKLTKDVQQAPMQFGADPHDPLAAPRKIAASIGTSNPVGVQAQKDADAFGKPGENNGVTINFGRPNEVSAGDGALGATDSPDGVLFICTLNRDDLQGQALSDAILHMGQHIAELRDPHPGEEGAPLYRLEANAWDITVWSAMAGREQFLTVPGGYVLWDAKWPKSDIASNFTSALNTYLEKEALLSH